VKRILLLFILFGTLASAQTKVVTGKVTYVAMGTIYTSLGRESGVQDSSIIFVLSKNDTLALLKVFAVSSQSSACRVWRSTGPIAIGDVVSASVVIVPKQTVVKDSTAKEVQILAVVGASPPDQTTHMQVPKDPDLITLRGRISAQYYGTRYELSNYNTSQPGVVVNLRGNFRDLPLKFEVYGNLRTLSYGGVSPFSRQAINQGRIYRLSLAYDDGVNTVSLGRTIPAIAPYVGYVDGAMVSRQFGGVVLGSAFGYQPTYSLWGVETTFRKIAVFAGYRAGEHQNLLVSSAYSRTYYQRHLDREVATAQLNLFSSGGLFFYANSEFDLRMKSGNDLAFKPSLTSMYVNLNYRLNSLLTVGVGADASRPFYTYSLIQNIPDAFLDFRLRSGVSVSLTLSLPGGVTLFETFSPRNSESGFGREYSNVASFSFTDILSSGLNVRTNMNHNSNEFTDARGYGFNLQRNFLSVVDVGMRYQQYNYTVSQVGQRYLSRTLGGDLLVSISSALSIMVSYEKLDNDGASSRSLFAEFSVRF